MNPEQICAILEGSGYTIQFRQDEWVECLLSGDGESFVGSGADRNAALASALKLALPSALAARLLCEAAGQASDSERGLAPHVWPPWRGEGAVGSVPARSGTPSSRRLPSVRLRGGTPAPGPRASSSGPVEVAAEADRPPGQIAVIVSRPAPIRQASGTHAVSAVTDQRSAQESPAVKNADEALEELDILMDRIRDSREELGLCAPDRQRLAMLAWICLARSHTDAFPDDLRVRDRVSAISRQLTEIGKTFWPGSVTALQLHMQPRDLPRHLLGGVATTWRRAAELAEQALRNKEHEDERRGYDRYGWGDHKLTFPRPVDAKRVLSELIAEVEALSGSIELQAAPNDGSIRPDGAIFQRWVRTARWLRGSEIDPGLWARTVGRFRWWAFRRESTLQPAARELEPGYVPAQTWATLLGRDAEQQRHEQELREVLSASPDGDDRAAWVAWLGRALQFGDTHHGNIVQLAKGQVQLIGTLSPEDLPDGDRRLRRRLSKLQADLAEGSTDAPVTPLPASNGDSGVDADSGAAAAAEARTLPTGLLERVRPVTKGKRSVYVSNRLDPDLQAKLQEAFGFETLDCRIAEARRVQQLGEAIAEDKYDLVLGATGFQSHTLDTVLARACRQAGVQYVRVNHGQPLTCLRAVARDLNR